LLAVITVHMHAKVGWMLEKDSLEEML